MLQPKIIGVENLSAAPVDYRAERAVARAAEFLVAYDIGRRGYDCALAAEGLRYDVIADINGLRRIQVKMNHRAVFRHPHSISSSYTFGSKQDLRGYSGSVDLFAFVAMDCRVILYVPPHEVVRAALHVKAQRMTPEANDLSWTTSTSGWMKPC